MGRTVRILMLMASLPVWQAIAVEAHLFTVRTDSGGAGSAFLMEQDGRVWMVSNCHVVQGDSTVYFESMNEDGRTWVLPDEFEVAANRDAIRFVVDVEHGFAAGGGVAFDATVFAFGNSEGRGVITRSEGKVVGKGRGQIEVTCEIVPGNSGGPIIDLSNQVVGISTFIYRALSDRFVADSQRYLDALSTRKGTRYEHTRRFAVPIHDAEWQTVERDLFQKESVRFIEAKNKSDRLRRVIYFMFYSTPVSMDYQDVVSRSWLRDYNEGLERVGFYSRDLERYLIRTGQQDSYHRMLRRWTQGLVRTTSELAMHLRDHAERHQILYFQNELLSRAEQLEEASDDLTEIAGKIGRR